MPGEQTAAVLTLTQDQLQAAIAAAVAQALAAQPKPAPIGAAAPAGLSPRSVVQPKKGSALREGEAGVVERLERDASGAVSAVVVKMDLDGKLEHFHPDELNVLLAH